MSRRPPSLDALYAQVPRVHCKGLCADQCTTIVAGPAELERIHAAGGCVKGLAARTPEWLASPCPSLVDGRCSVYRARPIVCRLYGSAVGLECPHGCEVDGGLLPEDVGHWLYRRALAVPATGGRRRR